MSLELTPVVLNRVLLVDDNHDETTFLKSLFERQKMTVDIARDVGQAISSFKMHIPDIVLLDVILRDDVSGFEVCERLKRADSRVPIIMLTGIDMDDARDLATRVGADAYLNKPYDPNELLELVNKTAEASWSKNHLDENPAKSERVRFECNACGKRLKASASHRGHRMNCPGCGEAQNVPLHD